MKNFNISTNVYFGENSLGILDTIQDKHVLIVCDSFMESSGIVDKVKEHLSACQVDVFSKVVPDPPIEIVSDYQRYWFRGNTIFCDHQCAGRNQISFGE